MSARTRFASLLITAGLAAAGCGDRPAPPLAISTVQPAAPIACDAGAVEEVVQRFGERMKHVSLLAADSIAARDVRLHYDGLVAPALLETWATSPARAPGRMVSSPWPDRIDVLTLPAAEGEDCLVDGEVVYASSVDVNDQGAAWREPVTAQVRPVDGAWLITGFRHRVRSRTGAVVNASLPEPAPVREPDTSYTLPETVFASVPEQRRASAEETAPAPAASRRADFGAVEAAEVVRQYYAAIDGRDYRRAYALWADGGAASRKTYEQFSSGFAETEAVEVTLGEPAPSALRANGTYVDVPVVIRAVTASGVKQEFRGRYTIRQTKAEGGWHIDSARIRVAR